MYVVSRDLLRTLYVFEIHTLDAHLGAKCGKNCGFCDTLDNFSLIIGAIGGYAATYFITIRAPL